MGLVEELDKIYSMSAGKEQDALLAQVKEMYNTADDYKIIAAYIDRRLEEVGKGIREVNDCLERVALREQMKNDYNLLPVAYIAREYFHKSRSWLYQRINGNKVRGRVYTLNEKEKAIFNEALQDIAKRISSMSIV
ncbi:MAG: DUF5053 domain-containing protein [Mediterranea sp.]|jgi:hypothetical protein|nr:DUF5053 domain-containing protein [Mediterranea sp.]